MKEGPAIANGRNERRRTEKDSSRPEHAMCLLNRQPRTRHVLQHRHCVTQVERFIPERKVLAVSHEVGPWTALVDVDSDILEVTSGKIGFALPFTTSDFEKAAPPPLCASDRGVMQRQVIRKL
jgi:hypothetical protein